MSVKCLNPFLAPAISVLGAVIRGAAAVGKWFSLEFAENFDPLGIPSGFCPWRPLATDFAPAERQIPREREEAVGQLVSRLPAKSPCQALQNLPV
jgi:hypothetical protein